MNQNEQGMVYAFRLSGSRMRQSAQNLRRQGQIVDAISLTRRAAEQEDTPLAWQALAAEMRHTGNWEVASRLLARVLSCDQHHSGVWADMARCMQALGQDEVAVDCAYHQLQEDPWGKDGDTARDVIAALDVLPDDKEPRRTQRLIHRGLTAWQSGDRATGERRIRRALRVAADKERLLVTTAMLCMLEMDFDGALHYLPRALRLNPEDPRTLTALSTLYQQLGKRRLARGFLVRAGKHADSVMAEDGFLTSAWAQDAWDEMNDYLAARMKRQPHRIPLLAAKATMLCENDDLNSARQLWKEILSIDPDDRSAATLLARAQHAPEQLFTAPGMLPRAERQRQLTELQMAAESLPMEDLLQAGSLGRRTLDWFLASSDIQERQYAMELLGCEDPAVIPYLKELLCRPFLRHDVRQWALIRLAEMGCLDEMLILAGTHYTMIACRKVDEETAASPWRQFLPELLGETRRYRCSGEILRFAAGIWRKLPEEARLQAGGTHRYLWAKAVEVLFLLKNGEEALAARAVRESVQSSRRISRVLRRIHRYMTK